jgi:CTP:molybdopterin cytidylyltransferase MocA
MISAMILSAGLSQRFGSPKALADIHGTTAIECLQKNLLKSNVSEVIIVLGHEAKRIEPHLLKHTQIKFVYNKDYNFGQTSSFQTGLKELHADSQGVFLCPVDTPFIKPETFNQLIQVLNKSSSSIMIPRYKNKKGHPPLFSVRWKEAILKLSFDDGLNTIAIKHPNDVVYVDTDDPGVVYTFNTQEEWKKLKQIYAGQKTI